MRRLRGPGGCPWDREQTIQSLRPFVLEETYEVLDAIDRDDHDALRGEIGDLLFEGVFLAQIEADDGRFTVADSLREVTAEADPPPPARVRHDRRASTRRARCSSSGSRSRRASRRTPAQRSRCCAACRRRCRRCWARTRSARASPRSASTGRKTSDVVDKIEEEVAELRQAVDGEGPARVEEEMGDLLFAIANLARKLGVEPESALRKANEKFTTRFQELERRFEAAGRSVHDATLEEMEAIWESVKGE